MVPPPPPAISERPRPRLLSDAMMATPVALGMDWDADHVLHYLNRIGLPEYGCASPARRSRQPSSSLTA
jgi:hypothetical protein